MAVKVDTNALTQLDSLKGSIGITNADDDILLTLLINRISPRIETLANRKFKARDWRFWITSPNSREIVLPQYPVIYVNRVAWGCTTALEATYSGAAIRATVQAFRDEEGATGGIRLVSHDTAGVVTNNVLEATTYASTDAMATAITAISGWTGTVKVNVPTLDLFTTVGQDASNRVVQFGYPDQDDNTYRLNPSTGIIELASFFGSISFESSLADVLVEARCGYETIPPDIEWLSHELIADAFNGRKVNRNLASESIGDYSYSLASRVTINDDQMALISSYRDIPVGSR